MAQLEPDHPVPRTEPHWYLTIWDEGCALCTYSPDGGKRRVRMPGKRPNKPSERFTVVGGNWACPEHFM